MGKLDGKVALVTGGTSGLGREVCKIFAREGASVVVVGRNEARGAETVQMCKDAGGDATFVRTDLFNRDDIKNMVQKAVEIYGGLDYAVNDAVLDELGPIPLAEIPDEGWDRSLAVNFTSVFLAMKEEIHAMLNRGGGAIVNIGSGPGYTGSPGLAWYLSCKHGSFGLVRCAALDYAKNNIRVNGVGPGVMWTPWNADMDPKVKEWMKQLSPMGRGSHPSEVAEAVVFMCSPAASFITGTILTVDGGATIA